MKELLQDTLKEIVSEAWAGLIEDHLYEEAWVPMLIVSALRLWTARYTYFQQ